MRNILLLLARFGAHLLFIGLEILCFYLIINYNHTQKDIFINSSSLASGKLNQKVNTWKNYLSLQEVNDSLRIENARHLEQIINISSFTTRQSDLDSSFNQYKIIPSTICSKTLNLRNNSITLCQGEGLGIKKGMGVISEKGIVGIIQKTSKNYAVVLPLINSLSNTSVSVKTKNYHGNLSWNSNNPLKMILNEVPKHANIAIGDTIITSGYSSIFPRGIMVGQINNFLVERGSANYSIDINLFGDITKLEYVYVIDNKLKPQIDSLQSLINE